MKPFFALMLSLFCLPLFSQDCLLDWGYFQEVAIDNSAGGTLTDYQVRLEINTGDLVTAGKLNADGSDLRFTDTDCNLLHFWADSTASNTANVIWVKMPELPMGSTTIRMYYGNTDAAPYANADSTFIFYDDFESGVVDFNKWEPVGSYATLEIVDGVLNYASDGMNPGPRFKFVRTAMDFTENTVFDIRAEVTNSNGFGFSSGDVDIERILFRQSVFGFDTLNQVALMLDTFNNGFQVEGMYPLIRWERFEMTNGTLVAGINGSDQLNVSYFGNNDNGSVSTDEYTLEEINMTSFHFIISSFLQAQTVYLDYIRVRKPADVEPTGTPGMEMENADPMSTLSLLPEGSFKVYPVPSSGLINIRQEVAGQYSFIVSDILGQPVMQPQKMNTGQGIQTINLSELPQGIYWMTIYHPDGYLVYREEILIY